MINSENNFYEQYGLAHVRDAMKRPFSEAFPAWTADPSPMPPVVPQIRTHLPFPKPQWMDLAAAVEENPAKSQRVEVTHAPQLPAPSSFLRSSLPVLAMRSQTKDLAAQATSRLADAKSGEATQNYWLEDVADADLLDSPGWGIASGMPAALCQLINDQHRSTTERAQPPGGCRQWREPERWCNDRHHRHHPQAGQRAGHHPY